METIITDERANTEALPNENMLLPEYSVVSKIGAGGYGAVYEVVDPNYQVFALKVQTISRTGLLLKKEFDIYNALLMNAKSGCRTPGIPWVYGYKEYEGLEYMVMERLGDNLDQIVERSESKQLSKADVLMIGIQAVRRLRDLHENGIIHRDVKPGNLAMGNGRNTERTVQIIDFGLARRVDDWATYNYGEEVGFAGTEYYASAEALLNKAPTRKGDLESLAYSLLNLACGGLPWQYIHPVSGRRFRDSEMAMQRLLLKPFLCNRFPELERFFMAVASTERTEKPNYEHLITLLETAVEEFEGGNNGKFEWLEPTNAVKSSSYILSEKKQQPVGVTQKVVRTAVKSFTETEPLVPPGFGFEVVRREERSVIHVKILPRKISHTQKADQTIEERFVPPLRPEKSSVLHGTAKGYTAPSLEQKNSDDNGDPLLDSDCRAIKTLTLVKAKKLRNQSQNSPVKTAPEIVKSESGPTSPQRESSNGIKVLFPFLLIMACYLEYQNQRHALNDNTQISQLREKSVSALTVTENLKKGNVGEVMKGCECKGTTRVELETRKTGTECATPKPSEARRGRKWALVKRVVSKGISRAVRAITGPAASKLVRIGGLRS